MRFENRKWLNFNVLQCYADDNLPIISDVILKTIFRKNFKMNKKASAFMLWCLHNILSAVNDTKEFLNFLLKVKRFPLSLLHQNLMLK